MRETIGQRPFFITLIGFINAAVIVGIVQLVSVTHLSARIFYTIAIIPYSAYVIYKVYENIDDVFNRYALKERTFTLFGLIDVFTAYYVVGGMILNLFWIWSQDRFFTLIGSLHTFTPYEAYLSFLLVSLYTGNGIGYGLIEPTTFFSESVTVLFGYLSFVLNNILLATGITVIMRRVYGKSGGGEEESTKRENTIEDATEVIEGNIRLDKVNQRDLRMF